MPVPAADAIVVLGTSRRDGNTHRAVSQVLHGRDVAVVDLAETAIGMYDYTHANAGDDFLALAQVLAGKSLWLLATPVYWYTMSAPMKVFMDRR